MSALSWHYYCEALLPKAAPRRQQLCDALGQKTFDTVEGDVARTGGALMMTEGTGGEANLAAPVYSRAF